MKHEKLKLANSKTEGYFTNKVNAFTLIELLAIIVILAIIAVITVPIILNVIENSRRGAAIDSAYGYTDSIYNGFLTELALDPTKELPNGIYVIDSTGKLIDSNGVVLNTNISGNTPEENSWVELEDGEVVAYSLKFDDYVVTKYKDTDVTAVRNGEIAENAEAREVRLELERQTTAKETALTTVSSVTGETEIKDITEGWVAFINGEMKAYSVKVTLGDYTYVVTDLDVNSEGTHAVADRTTSDLASKTSAEQAIINYYSEQVATEVSSYITSLATDTTIQGYTKNEGKKVSEISTTAVPTGMDNNSWIFYDNTSSSITDYSIKMTKGGYTFVVNCTDGTVSSPVYNGTITTPQKKPASFADDDWADIVANLTANRNFYPIGSEKEVEIDETSYTVRLSNTSSCPTGWTGSETACGVVIEFIDTIIDTDNNNIDGHVMNTINTNEGGWPASSMYSYLNTTIFNKLPDELKADGMIINTKSISGHGNQIGATNYTSTDDKLYLLSYVEVMGINNDYDSVKLASETVSDGTHRLEYYGTTVSTRLKTTPNGTANTWWLRSVVSSYADHFNYIHFDGTCSSGSASYAFGVAPAFRILN